MITIFIIGLIVLNMAVVIGCKVELDNTMRMLKESLNEQIISCMNRLENKLPKVPERRIDEPKQDKLQTEYINGYNAAISEMERRINK